LRYLGQDDDDQDSTSQTGQDLNVAGSIAASITSNFVSPVDTTLRQVDQGVNAAASIIGNIPGIGPVIAGVLKIGEALLNVIGLRSGADEANIITSHIQTPLGNQLIAINNAIAYATPEQLATMFQAVEQLGSEFRQFVANPVFTDGRASKQGLNTIMPLIDGSGSYTSKNSQPGCIHCGPIGPAGSDGTLGSINYRLVQLGYAPMTMPPAGIVSTGAAPSSQIMAPPQVTQGAMSSYYPTLESASGQSGFDIVQAGSLPLYPATSPTAPPPAVVSTGLFGAGDTPLIVGAVLLYLFLRKRG